MSRLVSGLALAVLVALAAAPTSVRAQGPTLRGSPESMVRQNRVAKDHGLPFVATRTQMRRLVDRGDLVLLEGNDDYGMREGRSPQPARPEMRLFLERLAADYRAATGERLIVTSATRASTRQPRNSHPLSVHPVGIAVDLRVSQRAASRAWLEAALLELEREGVLDVTREYRPPHYHLALFPAPWLDYLARREVGEVIRSGEGEGAGAGPDRRR